MVGSLVCRNAHKIELWCGIEVIDVNIDQRKKILPKIVHELLQRGYYDWKGEDIDIFIRDKSSKMDINEFCEWYTQYLTKHE